jgi:hypothetical protein
VNHEVNTEWDEKKPFGQMMIPFLVIIANVCINHHKRVTVQDLHG